MPNVTDLYSLIGNQFGETATIKYTHCIEIVDATTVALQSERDLALLFLFTFVMIISIKYLWNMGK